MSLVLSAVYQQNKKSELATVVRIRWACTSPVWYILHDFLSCVVSSGTTLILPKLSSDICYKSFLLSSFPSTRYTLVPKGSSIIGSVLTNAKKKKNDSWQNKAQFAAFVNWRSLWHVQKTTFCFFVDTDRYINISRYSSKLFTVTTNITIHKNGTFFFVTIRVRNDPHEGVRRNAQANSKQIRDHPTGTCRLKLGTTKKYTNTLTTLCARTKRSMPPTKIEQLAQQPEAVASWQRSPTHTRSWNTRCKNKTKRLPWQVAQCTYQVQHNTPWTIGSSR